MIAHALTILKNELERHLTTYGGAAPHAELGNVAEVGAHTGNNAPDRNRVLLSAINLQQEHTLRNVSHYVRDDAALRVRYENPPTYLNLAMLATATHANYDNALLALSRVLLFFQSRTVFTHDDVDPASITTGAPLNDLDRLREFRLVLSLASPSLQETYDMWGMLGGKQYPFALYSVRALEMRFAATLREGALITEVLSDVGPFSPAVG